MTRTVVVREITDELAAYHRLAREALEAWSAAVKPGLKVRDLRVISCEPFKPEGYRTQPTCKPGEVSLESSFTVSATELGLKSTRHRASQLGRVAG